MSKAQELATLLDKEQIDTVRRDVMNHEAATLLRTQDALLRQALEALNNSSNIVFKNTELAHLRASAVNAIQEHLK